MIELSQQKMTEARKLGVPVQNLIMADLMAIGYPENDAYDIAYPENRSVQKRFHDSMKDDITRSAKFRKLLVQRRDRIKDGSGVSVDMSDIELVGTETVMKEILRSAMQLPIGSKDRADLFVRYNDIKLKSEVETDEDDDRISFVFPIKCNQCPLLSAYNSTVKANGGRELKPIEMERVIRLAKDIIDRVR